MDERETDAELLARYDRVSKLVAIAIRRVERKKLGTPARSHEAQWAGCLTFTKLQIESELRERNLCQN